MKKTSIITTCFNQEQYIADAIESVLNQTYKNWEMIIIDDCSTDDSTKIIKKYQKQDKRIKLFQLDHNSGSPILPRNTGINKATGEYILPLDADDKIASNCIEKMIKAMEMGLADVICCDVEYFGKKSKKMVLPEPIAKNLYKCNCLVNCSLFRKSDYDECGGFDENCADGWEDWDFWLNFVDHGKTFYRVPETLFFYRIKSNTRNDINAEKQKKLCEYIRQKHQVPQEYKQHFSVFQKTHLFFVRLFHSHKTYNDLKSRYLRPKIMPIKNPKLIMTLLVRNEADIIRENLEFHHAMGVDGFIVTDNSSTDNTRKILAEYKKRGWILEIIDEPSLDYSQSDWVHRMDILAKNKYGADWIINADADEFWRALSGNLKTELSQSQSGIIYVPIFNMHDKGGHWLDNTDVIATFMDDATQQKLIDAGKLSRFHQFSRQIPKCTVRASDYVHIHMGNHNADTVFVEPHVLSKDIKIYHYNSRGLNQFKMKIELGGAAFERNTKLGRDVGVHIRYFYEGIKNGTLKVEQEYEKNIGKLCMEQCAPLMHKDCFVKDFLSNIKTKKTSVKHS